MCDPRTDCRSGTKIHRRYCAVEKQLLVSMLSVLQLLVSMTTVLQLLVSMLSAFAAAMEGCEDVSPLEQEGEVYLRFKTSLRWSRFRSTAVSTASILPKVILRTPL